MRGDKEANKEEGKEKKERKSGNWRRHQNESGIAIRGRENARTHKTKRKKFSSSYILPSSLCLAETRGAITNTTRATREKDSLRVETPLPTTFLFLSLRFLLARFMLISRLYLLAMATLAVAQLDPDPAERQLYARETMPALQTSSLAETATTTSGAASESASETDATESDIDTDTADSEIDTDSDIQTDVTETQTDDAQTESDDYATDTASTTSMPRATTSASMPALTTTTLTSYTFHAAVPTATNNPYIIKSSLPTNSVFIVVAGVLGLSAAVVVAAIFAVWLVSRHKAKTDKAVQYYNEYRFSGSGLFGSGGSATHLMCESSQLSFLEKSSYLSGKLSESNAASLNWETTTPGRTYRELQNLHGKRSSMTISPIMEMMRTSASELSLPLFHQPPDPGSYLHMDSPSSVPNDSPRRSRPPSQVLDDILVAIEYSLQYPDGSQS